MVGHLLSLKWALFHASFRRSGWVVAGTVVALVLAGLFVMLSGALFLALRPESPRTVAEVAVVLGGILGLAWVVVPLIVDTGDQSLDPELLSPYPLRLRDVVLAQAASGLVGVLGPLTLLGLLTPVLAAHGILQALLGVVGALVSFLAAMVWSRIGMAAGRRLRRSPGLGTLLSALAYVALMLSGLLLSGLMFVMVDDALRPVVAGVLGWLPWAAPLAMTEDLAHGAFGLLIAHAGVALGGIALGLWLLRTMLRREFLTVGAASGGRRRRAGHGTRHAAAASGTGLRGADGPVSAVTVRTVMGLVKDPRMSFNLVGVVVIAVLFSGLGAMTFGSGSGFHQGLMAGPFAGLMAGIVGCYLVSYDNSAFSLHVLSPLTGRQDRWGRALGVLAVYLPVTVAVSVLTTAFAAGPGQIPANLAMSLGLCLVGVGVASYTSAVWAVPVPPPGASPFKRPGGGAGSGAKLAMFLASMTIMGLNLPAFVLCIVAAFAGIPVLAWVALAVAVVEGIGVVFLGVGLGARRYDRRAPELLAAVSRFR